MVLFQLIFLTTLGMVAWFVLCLMFAKFFGASKDSSTMFIMVFFIISGPIGWAILMIIVVYDMVDKIFQKKQK